MFARWSRIAFVVFALVASFFGLHRFFADKFQDTTGAAEWIWAPHRIASGEPIAFFASRDFNLPKERAYVHIKVVADPEYTLFFNGVEIGGGRPARFGLVDVYDVTPLARDRDNRIVAAMRSANGVGGFLLAIDLAPTLENYLVTDRQWRIHRAWDPRLLAADLPGAEMARSLGRPPFGRWNYLTEGARPRYGKATRVVAPLRVQKIRTAIPGIKVVSGVAIATSTPVVATAFDFGRIRGRTSVELPREGPNVVPIRFAIHEDDLYSGRALESLVLAKGERRVVDSEERTFRYVVVYGAEARVSVVKAGNRQSAIGNRQSAIGNRQ